MHYEAKTRALISSRPVVAAQVICAFVLAYFGRFSHVVSDSVVDFFICCFTSMLQAEVISGR